MGSISKEYIKRNRCKIIMLSIMKLLCVHYYNGLGDIRVLIFSYLIYVLFSRKVSFRLCFSKYLVFYLLFISLS